MFQAEIVILIKTVDWSADKWGTLLTSTSFNMQHIILIVVLLRAEI